ncbi:hypothetical protein DERF_006474 [Dermatophagoides farinae]|uniref:Uncharacterized protein n=1 Tax=Dermatophagoides farinae TaxID=6954 RepID=A0A922I8Y0_DERFA|nr:hypothetical protein DERF_006474 [Dermatophagoides farinae]
MNEFIPHTQLIDQGKFKVVVVVVTDHYSHHLIRMLMINNSNDNQVQKSKKNLYLECSSYVHLILFKYDDDGQINNLYASSSIQQTQKQNTIVIWGEEEDPFTMVINL